jgi:hypothetical protein
MPTINALPTVTSSELPFFDEFVAPVVVANQTKKIKLQTLRESILPKVMAQATQSNQDSIVFNNPTSITVNVYGQVTSVTPAGNQSATTVAAVVANGEEFKGDGQPVSSGVANISHIERHSTLPANSYVIPPFEINKSGHVLAPVFTISDRSLYFNRQVKLASQSSTSLGSPITAPEKDIALEANTLSILTNGLSSTYEADKAQLKSWFEYLTFYVRSYDATMVDLIDRVNRISYAVRQIGIADVGSYAGSGDDTNVEHRSSFLGRYNFNPDSPLINDVAVATGSGTSPTTRFFTVPFVDNTASASLVGNFSTMLNYSLSATEYPSIASGQTRDIWNDLRINATWVPAAVYNTTALGGGYAGSLTGINTEYVITKTLLAQKIAQLAAGQTQSWTEKWQVGTIGTGSGALRVILLQTPTVNNLRGVNASFATASDSTSPSNAPEYAKNTLLGYFTFSGRPNKYWVPLAGSQTVPNPSAIGSSPISIGFGSTSTIPMRVAQTALT